MKKKHNVGGVSGMNELYPRINYEQTTDSFVTWSKQDEYDPFTLSAVAKLDTGDTATDSLSTPEVRTKIVDNAPSKVLLRHDGTKLIGAYAIAGA